MKKYILLLIVFIVGVSGYWYKSYYGIDFFHNFSLTNYLPVKFMSENAHLHNTVVSKEGVVFKQNFDKKILNPFLKRNPRSLWSREAGLVTDEIVQDGWLGDGFLVIESQSEKDWAYQFSPMYIVNPGDVFLIKANVALMEDGSHQNYAQISLGIWDQSKKIVNWDYGKVGTKESGVNKNMHQKIKIPQGVAYITFRLSGGGVGKTVFDNLVLEKISKDNNI